MSHLFSTIASNTVAQLVSKFFGAGLTLLTTYFIISLNGLDFYGEYTKIIVLVALGFTAIDFGLNADALRRAHSESELISSLKLVFLARSTLAIIAILVLNILTLALPGGYSSQVKSVFWLGSLAIIFQGIFTSGNAYFQYKLSYWRSTLSVIVGAVVTTSLTLVSLFSSPTLINLVGSYTFGYFAMAIVSLALLPVSVFAPLGTKNSVLSALKSSALLGVILLASVVGSKLDTVILGVFRSSSEVGAYGFAYRIFDVILVLPVFVMNALYPLMLKGHPKLLRRSLISLGLLGVLAAATTLALSPLILYVRPGLELSVTSLRLLSLSLPLFYLTAPLMWHLITLRREIKVLTTYVLATILSLTLNLLFIPSRGTPAAALVTGATELFIFTLLLYHALNLKKT